MVEDNRGLLTVGASAAMSLAALAMVRRSVRQGTARERWKTSYRTVTLASRVRSLVSFMSESSAPRKIWNRNWSYVSLKGFVKDSEQEEAAMEIGSLIVSNNWHALLMDMYLAYSAAYVGKPRREEANTSDTVPVSTGTDWLLVMDAKRWDAFVAALKVPQLDRGLATSLFKSIVSERQKRLRESRFKAVGAMIIPVEAREEVQQEMTEAMGTVYGLTLSGYAEAVVRLALSLETYKERPFSMQTCEDRVLQVFRRHVMPLAHGLPMEAMRRSASNMVRKAIAAQSQLEQVKLNQALADLQRASRMIFAKLKVWQPVAVGDAVGSLQVGESGVSGISLPRFVQFVTQLLDVPSLNHKRASAVFIHSAPWALIYQSHSATKLLEAFAFQEATLRLCFIAANAGEIGAQLQETAAVDELLSLPRPLEPAHFTIMTDKLRATRRSVATMHSNDQFWYRW